MCTKFTLQEGDVLFLPKGLFHAAESDAVTSTHVTIGLVESLTWMDALEAACASLSSTEEQRVAEKTLDKFRQSPWASRWNRLFPTWIQLADPSSSNQSEENSDNQCHEKALLRNFRELLEFGGPNSFLSSLAREMMGSGASTNDLSIAGNFQDTKTDLLNRLSHSKSVNTKVIVENVKSQRESGRSFSKLTASTGKCSCKGRQSSSKPTGNGQSQCRKANSSNMTKSGGTSPHIMGRPRQMELHPYVQGQHSTPEDLYNASNGGGQEVERRCTNCVCQCANDPVYRWVI